jgi:hypothetical protein
MLSARRGGTACVKRVRSEERMFWFERVPDSSAWHPRARRAECRL